VRYEDLLASVSDEPLDVALSPDDLYVLYTGGTTGMPKAVLWRQHDIYRAETRVAVGTNATWLIMSVTSTTGLP
jgi:acyl-coenzyme A synthetase/AMP-(fatty) acid ligase